MADMGIGTSAEDSRRAPAGPRFIMRFVWTHDFGGDGIVDLGNGKLTDE